MATNHFIPRGPYARKQECTDCNNNEYDNRYFDGNEEDDRKNGSKEKVPVKKNPVLDSVTDRNKECKKEEKKEDKDDCFDPKDLQENDRNLDKPLYWYLNEKLKDGDKYENAQLEKYVSEGYRVIFHIRYDDFDNNRQSKEVNVLLSRGKANKGTVMFTQEIPALQMRNNTPSLTGAGPIDRMDCSKLNRPEIERLEMENVTYAEYEKFNIEFRPNPISPFPIPPLPISRNNNQTITFVLGSCFLTINNFNSDYLNYVAVKLANNPRLRVRFSINTALDASSIGDYNVGAGFIRTTASVLMGARRTQIIQSLLNLGVNPNQILRPIIRYGIKRGPAPIVVFSFN